LAKATEGVAGVTCDMPSQTGQNKVMFISDLFFYMSRIQTCPKVFQNCPKLKMFQMYPKQAWGRMAAGFFFNFKVYGSRRQNVLFHKQGTVPMICGQNL